MKHKTTFEKLPQANTGRSKNWKTLRAICLLLFFKRLFHRLFPNNSECERHLFESLFKENRASKQLQILLQ